MWSSSLLSLASSTARTRSDRAPRNSCTTRASRTPLDRRSVPKSDYDPTRQHPKSRTPSQARCSQESQVPARQRRENRGDRCREDTHRAGQKRSSRRVRRRRWLARLPVRLPRLACHPGVRLLGERPAAWCAVERHEVPDEACSPNVQRAQLGGTASGEVRLLARAERARSRRPSASSHRIVTQRGWLPGGVPPLRWTSSD